MCDPHAASPAAVSQDRRGPAAGIADDTFELPGVRVALVHEGLTRYGEAERALGQLLRAFPGADLFAPFDFLAPADRGFLGGRPVRTSFLQRLPLARSGRRALWPLMPLGVEHLDLGGYDLVISCNVAAAKGVLTGPDQLHVCYCHAASPALWDAELAVTGGPVGLALGVARRLARHYLRNWDVRSANRVDAFLVGSRDVGRRIEKLYRRPSTPVPPPAGDGSPRPAHPDGTPESFSADRFRAAVVGVVGQLWADFAAPPQPVPAEAAAAREEPPAAADVPHWGAVAAGVALAAV